MLIVRLLPAIIFLFGYPAGSADPVSVSETLEECDRLNKPACSVGAPYSDLRHRDEINRLIESNNGVREHFRTVRLISVSPRINRSKRATAENATVVIDQYSSFNLSADSNESKVDCSSVCCVRQDMTPPFSHVRDYDGWHEVASTPEYPQRVSFATETCLNAQSLCLDVKPVNASRSARCVQFYRHQTIAVFNKLTGLSFRYIELPSNCKCVLAPTDQPVVISPIDSSVLLHLQSVTSNVSP